MCRRALRLSPCEEGWARLYLKLKQLLAEQKRRTVHETPPFRKPNEQNPTIRAVDCLRPSSDPDCELGKKPP